jgi:hypothetical protein
MSEAEAKRVSYSSYRVKCAQLERDLAYARSQIPENKCVATVEYLLSSAEIFIRAACVLADVSMPTSNEPGGQRNEGESNG